MEELQIGEINFPNSNCLSNLTRLTLWANMEPLDHPWLFFGHFVNLLELSVMFLGHKNIDFGILGNLTKLHLAESSHPNFSGANFPKLKYLMIEPNCFDEELTGVPEIHEIKDLINLETLILKDCQAPGQFSKLTNL